ncbi:hypothetical protein PDN30_15995 [Bacillus cereus]|nr:hypothetical protein [Bacillus cereus]
MGDYYSVPGNIRALQQRTSLTNWATAAAIMVSWKDSRNYNEEDIMGKAGKKYKDFYNNNQGFKNNEIDKNEFLQLMGLEIRYGLDNWLERMQQNGPLWITRDPIDVSYIVTGIRNGTYITCIDPAEGLFRYLPQKTILNMIQGNYEYLAEVIAFSKK